MFLEGGWRGELCRCADCTTTYEATGLAFLLDPEDTVHHYEAKGKQEQGSQYNSMKTDLMEYLKTFDEEGKVVMQEDITKFFALKPEKAPENTENKYNQNFRGVYCICHRPYPDPEDTVPDEMIQCVVCEDWFHSRHLGRAEEDCDKDVGNANRLVDPDYR